MFSVFFFFFKQKTAYEMRISDWSSDVCSSDLTGGYSLYEAKRQRHDNAHPFPSSVDVEHFAAARRPQHDPDDQAEIPHPLLGFYGVKIGRASCRERVGQ